jgi:hypothetical protein
VLGERALTPSCTVGNDPGVNGSAPSTIMAPAGAVVRTHGGAEEVDEETLLEERLRDEDELKEVVGAEDDVEVVEGAALDVVEGAELLEDGLGIVVEVVEGAALLEDGLELLVIVELKGSEEVAAVVEVAVLMQEQPLEILDGKFEQTDAHVGSATEVVARV